MRAVLCLLCRGVTGSLRTAVCSLCRGVTGGLVTAVCSLCRVVTGGLVTSVCSLCRVVTGGLVTAVCSLCRGVTGSLRTAVCSLCRGVTGSLRTAVCSMYTWHFSPGPVEACECRTGPEQATGERPPPASKFFWSLAGCSVSSCHSFIIYSMVVVWWWFFLGGWVLEEGMEGGWGWLQEKKLYHCVGDISLLQIIFHLHTLCTLGLLQCAHNIHNTATLISTLFPWVLVRLLLTNLQEGGGWGCYWRNIHQYASRLFNQLNTAFLSPHSFLPQVL